MIEELLKNKQIYQLDFIDLQILEVLIKKDNSLALSILVKELGKVNVWSRDIRRRRIKRLKELKILYYEENRNPIIIEPYYHKEKELQECRELLKQRLIRY